MVQCPRAVEYQVAIQNVLENYTTDIADGMIRYGVHSGFDAWRKLYHHYVPLAEDLQQILIQELSDLKPLNEADIDKLFNELQRISEWYVRAGSEAILESWLVAAVKRDLPIKISTDMSMQIRTMKTMDEIRNAINIFRHDHRTGLPRGVPGTMLAMTETASDAETQGTKTSNSTNDNELQNSKAANLNTDKDEQSSEDLYAVPKGGKGKHGKGYGQCWECGEWGHPRRECPKFPARTGGKSGDVAAFNVAGRKLIKEKEKLVKDI